MTAPSLFLLLRRQRALREHGLAMLGTPGRVCAGLAAPAPPDLGAPPHAPGVCAGLAAPTPPDLGAPPQPPGVCAGLVAPTPPNLGAPPQTPGDFPVAGKVTEGAPRAVPFGIPEGGRYRSPCGKPQPPRWGFCHSKRPICHFEFVGKPVFIASFGFDEEESSAFNPWRRSIAGAMRLHVCVQLLGRFGV